MVGCGLSSTLLIPEWGMHRSLLLALSFNGVAALLLALCAGSWAHIRQNFFEQPPAIRRSYFLHHEQLAFGLGACALAYELILLRINILFMNRNRRLFRWC